MKVHKIWSLLLLNDNLNRYLRHIWFEQILLELIFEIRIIIRHLNSVSFRLSPQSLFLGYRIPYDDVEGPDSFL